MIDILGWIIAALLVVVTVLMHYEAMLHISDRLLPWAQRRFRDRRVMMVLVFALMAAHITEIWLFAFATMVMAQVPALGALSGDIGGDLWKYVYYSAANYTSLGDESVHPQGPLRSVIVSETLTGLMMIAWSASFTYLKMEQLWKTRKEP